MVREPYTVEADGLILTVRLTPRAGRDALDGIRIDAEGRQVLCLRVAAPPVEGTANAALVAFVARRLGLRRTEVSLASGEASRTKRLRLSGDPTALAARIDAWIGEAGESSWI